MITIRRKEDCVGCNACVQSCPKQCIFFNPDEQGFSYPKVDEKRCINCGLCEKVCPVINQSDSKIPDKTYAGWNTDEEVRQSSSSGGIFYALAKNTIDDRGVVFGARFNDKWEVIHSYTDTLDGINAFQGSKYVQSKIDKSYLDAERFLKSGRRVLFSGTPCQIAGLKRFLRKDYERLLMTVDVVCHGVPSPEIWKEYLNAITRHKDTPKNSESEPYLKSEDATLSIDSISFRNKRLGWEKYGLAIHYATTKSGQNKVSQSTLNKDFKDSELFEFHRDNIFMQGFLKDLYLRPSCYECPAKCGKSHSDITLGDFWGIKNHYLKLYSDKGVSLVLANSDKGIELLKNLDIKIHEVSYTNALSGNLSIIHSALKPKQYSLFWKEYKKNGINAIYKVITKINWLCRLSIPQRIVLKLLRILKNSFAKK